MGSVADSRGCKWERDWGSRPVRILLGSSLDKILAIRNRIRHRKIHRRRIRRSRNNNFYWNVFWVGVFLGLEFLLGWNFY